MTTTGDCKFCLIRDHLLPGVFVYEDKDSFAIRDIAPMAPVHVLVIPREHIATVGDLVAGRFSLMGHLIEVATLIARQEDVADSGYRLVVNNGKDAGMGIPHLHVHLLGGRKLSGIA